MIADVKKTAEQKMKKTVETLKTDLAKVRTGRAHTGLLDHIVVDYYGTPDARAPGRQRDAARRAHDRRDAVGQEDGRGDREGDPRFRPGSQSRDAWARSVRVPMPALTEERRKDLIKVVRHEGENARVAVRNVRRDAIHQLKDLLKQKKVAEDEERRAQDEMQKLTDRHIADIDKLLQQKEADLMAV